MARLSVLALLAAAAAPAGAVRMQQKGGASRELAEASLSMASGVSAHRPLCDPAIVRETCAILQAGGNASSAGAADIEAVLSATPASALRLWDYLGLTGPAACADLCQKVVDALARLTVLPPKSDIGCFRAGERTLCNIDLDPAKVLEDSRFRGDLPDFHDKEVRREAVEEGEDLGEDDVLDGAPIDAKKATPSFRRVSEDGLDYGAEELVRRVGNLFRIFPAEAVTMLEEDANASSSLAEGVSASQAVFQRANAEARRYVDGAIRMLNVRQRDSVMTQWYGSGAPGSATTRREIQRVLNSVQSMLSNVQFVYPGRQCSPNTYAYVYPKASTCSASDAATRACTRNLQGQFVFYMCQLTVNVRLSEQIETMTHEGSHHATAFTDDVVYGRSQCQSLARTQPSQALRNADNLCYYIQDMTDR